MPVSREQRVRSHAQPLTTAIPMWELLRACLCRRPAAAFRRPRLRTSPVVGRAALARATWHGQRADSSSILPRHRPQTGRDRKLWIASCT